MKKMLTMLGGVALLVAVLALPGSALARRGHHHRAVADRNHDRIPDRWERRFHLSLRINQAGRDQDHDGLSNRGEFLSRTSPRDADTNDNGITDANEDRDHDGVDNGNEMDEHTNPADPDSDNDGIRDGAEDADHDGLSNRQEDALGDDPTDADTDGDGVRDGAEDGGHVVSFDGTVLTISRPDGSTVSGQVTDATELKCEGADDFADGDQGDDASGDGSNDQGDEQGSEASGCSTADLREGAVVHEAKLDEGSTGGAVFEEVELVK